MRIIKRKKGNIKYHYLQHSFRKDGKVITKEKYLGKKIPKNIEEIKKDILNECKIDLFKKLEKIKEKFQKEWKKYPGSIKEKIKQQIAVDFIYNTNAIEGSTISHDETRDLIEKGIAPNKPLRDIKETEAHTKVFLEMLNKKEDFDEKLILKWHKEMFKETKQDIAGKFRDYLVRVGSYMAPDWQDIKKLMKEFFKFYNKNKKLNPVELAGRIHYKFETIHLFGDGNGRVGRMIMNYILWHNKQPILIIEYKKRNSYYKALQKGEEKFLNYFIRRYLKIYERYLK